MKVVFFLASVILVFSAVFAAPVEHDKDVPKGKSLLTCGICSRFINIFAEAVQNGTPDEVILDDIAIICNELNIFTDRVCRGTAEEALPTIKYLFTSTSIVQGNICGILLPTENCTLSDPDAVEWTIPESPVPKPPVSNFVRPPIGAPTLKVLHLADVHWDPDYLEGSNAVCGEPLCCRADSPGELLPGNEAGFWGDYRVCDIPWRTVENAMATISRQHPDIDYIIWTGDLVPHDVWSTQREENLMIIDRLLNLVKTYFPNIPFYPTLGNHESNPVNIFAPPEVTDEQYSIQWLYDEADRQWASWLPADVSSTIRYGGYYTALIKPGLRIVSMNMNYCYTFNWWTLIGAEDPASGLTWLSRVLQNAENNNEKVHIMSHIPPGNSDCWTTFSREYTKLTNRYESTIAAQFFGHTHNEELKIFYDGEGPSARPTNVAFIGGSLTTYSDTNPGYRIYTVDGERPNSTFAVLEQSTWIMNLTAANAEPEKEPSWSQLYEARSDYGLNDLSPASMNEFFNRMVANDALFQVYRRNYYKGSEYALNLNECDANCRADLLCRIVTTNIGDDSHCANVKRRILSHQEF